MQKRRPTYTVPVIAWILAMVLLLLFSAFSHAEIGRPYRFIPAAPAAQTAPVDAPR